MTNTVVNALIAGVLGVAAFIAVRALIIASGVNCCGATLSSAVMSNDTTIVVNGTCGTLACPYDVAVQANISNCSYGGVIYEMNATITGLCPECWAGVECTLMGTILPLAIAITAIVVLFIGLTKMRGL